MDYDFFGQERERPVGVEMEAKYPILKFFKYEHLPPALAEISKPFAVLAEAMIATLPEGPEVSAGLRKLLEAKDCFVRAKL